MSTKFRLDHNYLQAIRGEQSRLLEESTGLSPKTLRCAYCGHKTAVIYQPASLQGGSFLQSFKCKKCGEQFFTRIAFRSSDIRTLTSF